jgi:hypothetical protein
VSEVLGHKEIAITLDRYSHALPTMQAVERFVTQRRSQAAISGAGWARRDGSNLRSSG